MPAHWLPYIPSAAIVISVIALVVSGANLGWSIYKEIGLHGRLRIHFGLKGIHHESFREPLTRFVFSVTNLGPGKVKLKMLYLREAPLWRRVLRRCRYAALMHDYRHPLGGRLPYVLDVGEGIDFTSPIEDSFVEKGYTHIGIIDSFGRMHWCASRDMKEARKALAKEMQKRPNKALEPTPPSGVVHL